MQLSFAVSLLFTPEEVLVRGFDTISGLPSITTNDYTKCNISKFKEHFGLSPSVIAFVWSDILTTDIDLGLDVGDKSKQEIRKLLVAIHFVWTYPKNAGILAPMCGTY